MNVCSFKGCDRTDDLSEVVITFKDSLDAPENHRIEAVVQGLLVCPGHAIPQPASFVTDDGWNKIVAGLLKAGWAAPNRETVKVAFRHVVMCTYSGCKNTAVFNGFCDEHKHRYYATEDDV